MAALQIIRERGRPECGKRLSPHESRCLYARLAECEELLQRSIVGADQACDKARQAPELVAISASLEVAEAQISRAMALANQVLIGTPTAVTTPRPGHRS